MLGTRSLITIGATTLALAAPATAGAQQDLRSPDARDAAARSGEIRQDLRSPDARDAATLDVRAAEPVPAVDTSSASDGFEWGHAGIGGAATLAIVLAIGGMALLVTRRRVGTPSMH